MLRDYRPGGRLRRARVRQQQRRRSADAAAAAPERGAVHLRPVAGHDRGLHVRPRLAPTAGGPARTAARTAARSGLSEETILRNTLGLKNVANSLLELRSPGGPTRPDERQRGQQPPAQDLLGAVDVQRVPRLPPRATWPRSRSAIRRDRASRSQHRPDRVPRLAADPGVPGAASGREPAARTAPPTRRSSTTRPAPTSSPRSSTRGAQRRPAGRRRLRTLTASRLRRHGRRRLRGAAGASRSEG